MSKLRRTPRLFGFTHFIAAAGILGGGFTARAMGEAIGQDTSWFVPFAALACALQVGMGIGELRGLKYARHIQGAAVTASEQAS